MASVNIRELVLETLLLINRDGEYSHIALAQVLGKYQYLDKKDRAFLTRTVEGTLERRIEIDRIINQFSSVKINKNEAGHPGNYKERCLSVKVYGQCSCFCCLQ